MKEKRYTAYAAICISFLYLLCISWNRWGSIFLDTFLDPWISHMLLEGKALYKDIFFLHGFLTPYIIAFLYKLFGVKLALTVYVCTAVTAATSFFIYRISRFFLNRAFSVLITVNFLFVFAFGQYCYSGIFNFILPYAVASIFLTMFMLMGLFFFIRFLKKGRYTDLVLWGVGTYLALLSRPCLGAFIYAAFLLSGFIHSVRRKRYLNIVYLTAPILAAFMSYFIFLRVNNSWSGFKESVIDFFLYSIAGKNAIEREVSGLKNIYANLGAAIKAFVFLILIPAVMYMVNAALYMLGRKMKRWNFTSVFFYTASIAASFGLFLTASRVMDFYAIYKALPLLMTLGTVYYGWGLFYKKSPDDRAYPLFALFAVSLAFLPRIFLDASPNYYGFFLLPPALISTYVFFANEYPRMLSGAARMKHNDKAYYLAALFTFFALLIVPFEELSRARYEAKNVTFSFKRGTIRCYDGEISRNIFEALLYLRNTPPDSRAVVMPEGIGLNFFACRDNPVKYHTVLPHHVGKIGEEKIINELKAHRIDYIVIIGRTTPEFGAVRFGIDYGADIYEWVIEHFTLVKTIGSYPFRGKGFGIAIYKNREDSRE